MGWLVSPNEQPGNHVTPNFLRCNSDSKLCSARVSNGLILSYFSLCYFTPYPLTKLHLATQVWFGKGQKCQLRLVQVKSISVASERTLSFLTSLKSISPDAKEWSLLFIFSNTPQQNVRIWEEFASFCLAIIHSHDQEINTVQMKYVLATSNVDLMWAFQKTSRTEDGKLRHMVDVGFIPLTSF